MMSSQHPDHLSPEKLQLFVAGLSGLAPEEMRKAKLLYIRNAISEINALQVGMAGMRQMQGCMAVIPIFWPIIRTQRRMMDAQMQLQYDRVQNAIDVWRDDLRGERFVINGEEFIA
ncbi:MAG TPA: hypothetical protein PJ982_08895 [Lacipirellulaceae bacterium]|nr:hypothetical protein [Lacipirellulaceae bacterium]